MVEIHLLSFFSFPSSSPTLLSTLIPRRFQRDCKVVASADKLLGNAGDAVSAGANAGLVHGRDAAAHTMHTTRVAPHAATGLAVAEAWRGRKVESGEGRGFAECVTVVIVSERSSFNVKWKMNLRRWDYREIVVRRGEWSVGFCARGVRPRV